MKIIERKAQEIGTSLLVSLPKEWTRGLRLKKGSPIKMIVTDSGGLSIAPEFAKESRRKESSILFDRDFQRRFFREYLDGSQSITIRIPDGFKDKDRKDIGEFLKRFLNVQIIEEGPKKITVTSFTVEELSIEECLRRMHFLVLNMMGESMLADGHGGVGARAGKGPAIAGSSGLRDSELRDTISRFYYLLVMQVRRYLTEARFVKENQIPLVRALDCRMVAEKLQRMAGLIGRLESPLDDRLKAIIAQTTSYHTASFGSFITPDFERAVPLWKTGQDLEHDAEKIIAHSRKTGDAERLQNAERITQIIRFSREISMLVR